MSLEDYEIVFDGRVDGPNRGLLAVVAEIPRPAGRIEPRGANSRRIVPITGVGLGRLLRSLKAHGPQTAKELAVRFNTDRNQVGNLLRRARLDGMPGLTCVEEGHSRKPSLRYGFKS